MTLEEIKADIVASCKAFVAAGYKLQPGDYCFFSDADDEALAAGEGEAEVKPCGGCALTAVLFAQKGEKVLMVRYSDDVSDRAMTLALERYGWDYKEVQSFTDGFDGSKEVHSTDGSIYAVGKAVAAEMGVAS